jgi:hypothetical protein
MIFKDQDALTLLARDIIPAYLVKKLPPFYASLVRAWIDVKGMKDGQLWVIPRPLDPLPVAELSAQSAYGLLSKYNHIDHRSLAKFRDWGFSAGWKRVGLSFHGNPSKCRPSSLFQYEC